MFASAVRIGARLHRGIGLALAMLGLSMTAPTAHSASTAPVEALGLFKDRAMIRVMGQERYLKVGETSVEGARLVTASAELAVVSYQGETYRLTLTDRVGGSFAQVTNASISIAPDSLGQYRVGGSINGRTVDFLVDTGASVIAMSSRQADVLGIKYEQSPDRAKVNTAQGQAQSYLVTLDTVNVGGVETQNVRAAVIPGSYPTEVLLGMSYLRQVSMDESAGVLRLKQKY
jgi:aspartyl protease family protein